MRKKFRKIYAALSALLLMLYSGFAYAAATEEVTAAEELDRLVTSDDIWKVFIFAALIIAAIGVFNTIKMLIEHKDKKKQ